MRILYLADAPYPHTWRLVQHFARLGHDCEVISFRPAEIEGARVIYVDGFELAGKLRYLIHARRVARIIRERRPDLLHALHLTSYGFLGALADYHPYVLSVWGTDILEAPRKTPFHLWLTRYALVHGDAITATGDNLAEATAHYAPPGKKVLTIPYGVDLDLFRPQARQRRKELVIGSAARLSVEKGVRYLVEAFALLKDQYPGHVVLRIAGDGPERGNIERLARKLGVEIDFAGWLDHAELPAFLQGLDIFVLPSVFEGFGVAAVEAAAMELPVVGSRVHGIPDVVRDGETGLLVPREDPDGLAGAIARLMDDEGLRRRMGEAGRAYAAKRYDWKQNAADLERLYKEMTGSAVGAAG